MDMKELADRSELRRNLGRSIQLGKFSSKSAEITKPLSELLSLKNQWHWGPSKDKAFQNFKKELNDPNKILAHYDPTAETAVSAADMLSFRLGAVSYDSATENGLRGPIAYNSRSMTETEKRYPQFDKEALANTWACERFSDFLIIMNFKIDTDHKPLIPFLGSKDLEILPPRVRASFKEF